MTWIRPAAGLLLVAVGIVGADAVPAYLETLPHWWLMVEVYAGVVLITRLAVPETVSAGPYLIGALGVTALLFPDHGVWEWAPAALVVGGVAAVVTSVVGAAVSRRAVAAGPARRTRPPAP